MFPRPTITHWRFCHIIGSRKVIEDWAEIGQDNPSNLPALRLPEAVANDARWIKYTRMLRKSELTRAIRNFRPLTQATHNTKPDPPYAPHVVRAPHAEATPVSRRPYFTTLIRRFFIRDKSSFHGARI